MLVLDPAGGLHLDQSPAVPTGPGQDVGPDDDIVEGDEALIEHGHRRIGEEHRCPGETLFHLEVFHIHQDAPRVPFSGELPDPSPRVEDGLRPLVEGRRQVPGVDLQVEPFGTLQARQVPRLGKMRRHLCRSAHIQDLPQAQTPRRVLGGVPGVREAALDADRGLRVAADETIEPGEIPKGPPSASSHLVTRVRRSVSTCSAVTGFPSESANVGLLDERWFAMVSSCVPTGTDAGVTGRIPPGCDIRGHGSGSHGERQYGFRPLVPSIFQEP